VLKAKENQPNLLADCKFLFENETENILYDEVFEKNHGRIEKRKYYLYKETKNTIVDPKWDNIVNSIGKIEVTREYVGYDKKTVTEHYYVMNKNMSIDEFKKATRSHWGIECSLHLSADRQAGFSTLFSTRTVPEIAKESLFTIFR
jgi:hypothetical protein